LISLADIRILPGEPSGVITVDCAHVTPDYFDVMRIGMARGRALSPADRDGAAEAALVNETLARRLWPGAEALGRQISIKTQAADRWSTKTIVGVVRDVRSMGNRLNADSEVFVPFDQNPTSGIRIVLSTARTPDEIGPRLWAEIMSIDRRLPLGDVEAVSRLTTVRAVAQWRFSASLMGAFAIVALTLAAIGLFAVVGCWVTERTSEIGVRMALGASRGVVLRMFVGRAAILMVLGLVAGLTLAAFTTRFLESWLVNTSPVDRASFASAAAIMCAVCLLSAYLAARRAAAVDPLVALRTE